MIGNTNEKASTASEHTIWTHLECSLTTVSLEITLIRYGNRFGFLLDRLHLAAGATNRCHNNNWNNQLIL